MKYAIGARLKRRSGSGFIAGSDPSIVVIPDLPENRFTYPCLVCDADDCCEWPTLYSEDGTQALYHVSECELEPAPDVPG